MKLIFTVFGSPVAQPRTKAMAFVKGGRAFAHVYEPGKKDSPARQWKSDVKYAALVALNAGRLVGLHSLWVGPVSIAIDFYLPRPQSLCKKKDPKGPIPHVGKKDVDNLYKALVDALTGVVFVDDGQVWNATVRKFYHEKDRGPRAEVVIYNQEKEAAS